MVSFLDEKGLGELIRGIKANCQEWTKDIRKRKQTIIGKAIRIQSCDVTDAENWYVQNVNKDRSVNVRIPQKYGRYKITILYRHGIEAYTVGDFVLNRKQGVGILSPNFSGRLSKWKVDRYTVSDTEGTLFVWLSYKYCPLTIRGMGTRYEYLNGRKIWNRSFNIDDLRGKTLFEIAQHYLLYHRRYYYRNKKVRQFGEKSNLRWKRINKVKEKTKFKAGLYKAVCVDKKRKSTKSVVFYFTQSGFIKRA